MTDQAPLKKTPAKAFAEDLTLTQDEIKDIQKTAEDNTNSSIKENKDNSEHPDKTVTAPPDYTGKPANQPTK